jgi:hypothetical protein
MAGGGNGAEPCTSDEGRDADATTALTVVCGTRDVAIATIATVGACGKVEAFDDGFSDCDDDAVTDVVCDCELSASKGKNARNSLSNSGSSCNKMDKFSSICGSDQVGRGNYQAGLLSLHAVFSASMQRATLVN